MPVVAGMCLCPNTNEVGTMYICNYCKSSIKNNKLPPRCVLNGLEPEVEEVHVYRRKERGVIINANNCNIFNN